MTLMNAFYPKRTNNNLLCSLSYFLHFFATSIIYLCFDIPILTLTINFIILFVISLNYESNYKNKLMISFHILLLLLIPELVVGVFTGYIHFSFFNEAGYRNNIGAVSVRIITYMEALLIKNYKTIKSNNKVSNLEWTASIFIPIITLILEIMIIQSEDLSSIEVIVSLLLVLILNFIAFYLYDSLADSYRKLSDFAIMKKENNQFIILSELMDKHEYNLVQKHISDLFTKTENNIVYSTTGNIVIDGLINYKLQIAHDNNIVVDSEIAVPNNLTIDIADIVTILGNLLDNALSAVLALPEHKRKIGLKVVYNKDRLIIHSENPFNSEIKYLNGQIISSKDDIANHGYGLKNIERTVEKYDGYIEINHNYSVFKVDILLYISDYKTISFPDYCK